MKIVRLQAENIKKLTAIDITPSGNIVEITGPNGAGKTSVLDSIWWALKGAKHIQAQPIRNGEERASITLDMGGIVITRKFKREHDDTYTTNLAITSADGAKYSSPQAMLDRLLGELSFDPLEFTRLNDKQQFDKMRAFVPDVDFDAIENANRKDFDQRTVLNRRAQEERTLAQGIDLPLDGNIPTERVSIDALIAKMGEAAARNTDIELRRGNRERLADKAKDIRARAEAKREEAQRLMAEHDALRAEADDIESRLSSAPPLAAPIDVSDLQRQIEDAKTTNAIVDSWERCDKHTKAAEEYEGKAAELTARITERTSARDKKIGEASLPVSGIAFGENCLTMNGAPFRQASHAEQLRVSLAIAMAVNPEIRVIRITDGSLLDSSSLNMISEMVRERDYQVWIEVVDESGARGIVIEEGHVAKSNATESRDETI